MHLLRLAHSYCLVLIKTLGHYIAGCENLSHGTTSRPWNPLGERSSLVKRNEVPSHGAVKAYLRGSEEVSNTEVA